MKNLVILIGHLCADPETRYTQDGTCVCNLRLATSEKFKNKDGEKQEKTEFHRVVLWGRLGEIANQYLTKGARVYIEGKIETRKWQNKEGQDQYTTEIRANEMKMLGGGSQSNSGESRNDNRGQPSSGSFPSHGQQAPAKKNDPFADSPDFGDVPVDDDIPFN